MKLKDLLRESVATTHLAGPLIGGQLAYVGLNVLDTLMAGKLGAQALGAVAVGASAWQLVNVVVAGTLHGVTPIVAHLFGEGRYSKVGSSLRQALWLGQVLAAGAIAFLLFGAPGLLRFLKVDPVLIPTAEGYLRALTWGVPAVALFYTLRFASEGVGAVRPTLIFAVVALPANALLNWTLMFGKFGLPALGAVGTGYATAAVWWLQALGLLLYMVLHRRYRDYRLFSRFEWPHREAIAPIVRVGAPIGAAWFMEVSLFCLSGIMIGALGSEVVAGHQIALNVASLTFMIPFGIAMATTVRVGQALGAGHRASAARAAWSGIVTALAVQALAGGMMLLFPQFIAGLYTGEPRVQNMAVALLFLAAIFQLSDGIQAAAAGALRGYKDTRAVMWITLLSYWAIGMPLAYYLGFTLGLGARGFWIGFIGGLTVAAALLVARLRKVLRVARM